ncbi:MAG: trypsin-like peptidase domain-containing protein [Clostridia bacterium]|nr:trypsin-like peptidase domain-containing protein [Clostridia bacterium]
MNDNPFDHQNENKTPEYEVYSREYKPSGNQYNEYSYVYSHDSAVSGSPKKKRGGVGKAIALVALAVFLALTIFTVGIFIAARIIFPNMNQETPPVTDDQTEQISGGDETSAPPKTPANQDVFFGSEDETEIRFSDSTGRETKGEIGDDNLTVADVASLVSASVVEITTSETSWNGMVYESGAGSGVIVNESGIILTNNHVIEGATYITVRLSNGNTYDAILVSADAPSDIAVLKITVEEKLTTATVGNSDKLIVGEEVIAIGNPLGVLGGTVTNGIISALEREVVIDNEKMILLQHNAAVSPGNSGGALFNMKGELVGIVNAKSSTAGAEGIGFAIPINTVLAVYNDLINYGYVTGRPDSGLTLETVVRRVGYFYYEYDVCIAASRYTDELKRNDIIVSIDGKQPGDINEAHALLSGHEIGDVVTIVVSRNGTNHTVKLTIREYTPIQ